MDAIAKRVLYYNVIQNKLYNDNGDFMGNTQFNVFFDNVTSVELHYMADTNGNNVSDWVPWTALSGKPIGSSICFDDDYVHAKLGQVYETCVQGSSQIKVTVNLQEQNVNFSDVLIVYNEDGSSDSYPYSSYSYENGVYTFDLESTVSENITQGQSIRVPQALLLKVNAQDIDNSNASVGIFTFKIKSLSNKLLNRLDYSNTRLISGTFQHQIYSDGKNIATFAFPMSVSNLMDYHGQANVPKDGTWADKAYVDSKINSNAIVEQTDPIYSADKPNIALKSELFSRKFQDLIDVPNTVQGFGLTDLSLTDRTVSIGGNSVDVPLMNKSTIIQALGGDQVQGDARMFLNARGQFSYTIKSVNGRVPDQLGNISLNIESITTLDTLREQLGVICEVNGIVPQDSRRSITLDGSNIYVDPHDTDEAILLNDYLLNTVQTVNEITPESGNITLSAQNIPVSNEYSTVEGCLNYILQQLQSSGGQSGGGTVKSVMGFPPDPATGDVTLSTSAFSVDGYTQSMTYQDAFQTISRRLQEIGSGGGSSQEYNFVYPLQLNGSDVSIDLTEYALKTELFSKSFDDLTDKPTTLAGYGITDAYISGRTITLGGNSITVPESSGGSGDYTLTKAAVDGVIGASTAGSTTKFYNEQGAFTEVDMSGYLPLSGGTMTGTLNVDEIQADDSLRIGAGEYGGEYSSKIYLGPTNASISSQFGVSLRSSNGYIDLLSVTGVRINDVKAATVDDISTHNTDATSHANLFALKVDTDTYNTAITAINTALDGKENTGVAQGLVDAHNESATAHEALFEVKADKTEFENYLPLSGGTMTGGVLFNSESAVSGSTTASSITVNGGQGWGFGGSVAVYGSTHEARAGQVIIRAYDGTNEKRLEVHPDGTFNFDGQSVLNPIGTVIAFAGNSAPAGYLICNGAAVRRTTYAKLFAVIGTTYGAGDGSTTFNLPNLTDKFIMGSGTAGTSKAAGLPEIQGTFHVRHTTRDEYPNVVLDVENAFYSDTSAGTALNLQMGTGSVPMQRITFSASRSSSIYGNSTTVQPPAVTMRFYIKY